jgi:hypothetical protein
MTRRSAAVPFHLLEFERIGRLANEDLLDSIRPLTDSYGAFIQRCSQTVDPLPPLVHLVVTFSLLDAFTADVARAFQQADNAAIWTGQLSKFDYAVDTFGAPRPMDYSPFDSLRHDATGATEAGFRVCFDSVNDKWTYVLTGPDGRDYFLATNDANSSNEEGWETVWMEQGSTKGDDVDETLRWSYALSGMPDPLGTPATAEWYDQNFFVDDRGRPDFGSSPDSAYLSTTTPLYASGTPQREVTAGNVVAVTDTIVAAASAYQKSGNLNRGYYAVRLQKNANGNRRAIVTVYQQRGDRTKQADVTRPKDMPRNRRPRRNISLQAKG